MHKKIFLALTFLTFGLLFGSTAAKAEMREIGTVVYNFSPLLSSVDTTGFDLMTLGVPHHVNLGKLGLTVAGRYKDKEINLTSENNRLYFSYGENVNVDLKWLETYTAPRDPGQPLIFRAEKDGMRVMYIIERLSVDKTDKHKLTDLFGIFLADISP